MSSPNHKKRRVPQLIKTSMSSSTHETKMSSSAHKTLMISLAHKIKMSSSAHKIKMSSSAHKSRWDLQLIKSRWALQLINLQWSLQLIKSKLSSQKALQTTMNSSAQISLQLRNKIAPQKNKFLLEARGQRGDSKIIIQKQDSFFIPSKNYYKYKKFKNKSPKVLKLDL